MSGWRATAAVVGMAAVWLSGLTLVARDQASATRQTVAPAPGKKAGEAFKNVTTSALKELSVDDFIASMGLISANLGLDCADCHPNAGTDKADCRDDFPRGSLQGDRVPYPHTPGVGGVSVARGAGRPGRRGH